MGAKAKKQKSASPKSPTSSLSIISSYTEDENQLSDWLKTIKDFSDQWKGDVDVFLVDLTSNRSLAELLENNSTYGELEANHQVSIIQGVSSVGEGFKEASKSANGRHILTWTGNSSVRPQAIREWLSKYKSEIPQDTVLVGQRDFSDKATKKAVKSQEGTGANWFRAFTSSRIADAGNPVKLYPVEIARYLFQKTPGNSSCFEAEVFHRAEMDGIKIDENPSKYSEGKTFDSSRKGGIGSSLGRSIAFKWHYQLKEPFQNFIGKDKSPRPELLKSPQYGARFAFTAILLVLFIGMPLLSFDYGATGDEDLQDTYGQKLVDYYTSFGQDKSALNYKNLYLYGGLFETVASGAADLINPYFEENYRYEIRHVVNSLVGFLAILFTALLGRYLGGWRGGLLALLFLVLSPRFFGHTFNNPKDIPFAAFYIMGVYFMIKFLKEFPKPAKKTMTWLIVAIACAISVRIGGLLLIAYLGLFMLLELGRQFFIEKKPAKDRPQLIRLAFRYGLIIVLLGYFAGLIFWPYGHQNPFVNPFKALQHMSDFPVNITILFQGEQIKSANVPWDYIFTYLWYTTPIFALIGFGLFLLGVPFYKRYKNAFYYFILLFVAAFPVFYIIYKGSNLYDGVRQVLFVYPPFILMGSMAFNHLFESFQQKSYKIGLMVVLAGLMALPLSFMIKNHPNQYVYFNEILGGTKEAFGKYELDYWGHSSKQAAKWLGTHVPENGELDSFVLVRTNFVHGSRPVLRRYSDSFGATYVGFRGRSKQNWDYAVFINRFISPHILNNYWPPAGTIHQIKVDGAPIATIVRRPSYHDLQGFNNLEKQNYQAAIRDFEAHLKKDPHNQDVLLGLARAYLRTGQLNKARNNVQKALNINPSNPMALGLLGSIHKQQNNLSAAISAFEKAIRSNRAYAYGYLQLGELYYRQRQPRAALQYLNALRQIHPRMYKRAERLVQRCRQMLNR